MTLHRRVRYWASVGAGIVVGLILLLAGLGKLALRVGTFEVFYTPGQTFITPALADTLVAWLPPVELIVGLLLFLGVAMRLTAVLASVLTVTFVIHNGWLLSQGWGQESCGCFGALETVLAGGLSTTGALWLDIGMLALALIVVFCYPYGFLTTRFWFLRRR